MALEDVDVVQLKSLQALFYSVEYVLEDDTISWKCKISLCVIDLATESVLVDEAFLIKISHVLYDRTSIIWPSRAKHLVQHECQYTYKVVATRFVPWS